MLKKVVVEKFLPQASTFSILEFFYECTKLNESNFCVIDIFEKVHPNRFTLSCVVLCEIIYFCIDFRTYRASLL